MLDKISDEMLAACGHSPGAATTASYLSTDPEAVHIPLAEISFSRLRQLNEDETKRILRAFQSGSALPPIIICRRPYAVEFTLVDGLHRLRAALAFGFRDDPGSYHRL